MRIAIGCDHIVTDEKDMKSLTLVPMTTHVLTTQSLVKKLVKPLQVVKLILGYVSVVLVLVSTTL